MLGMTSVTLVRNSGGCSLDSRFSPAAGLHQHIAHSATSPCFKQVSAVAIDVKKRSNKNLKKRLKNVKNVTKIKQNVRKRKKRYLFLV